jgi:predicted RNase H-like HicB family nuclease
MKDLERKNAMNQPSALPETQTRYRAVVHPASEGGYWAEVPELPGCFTQGDTLDEVYRNLAEAVACHIDMEPSEIQIGLLEIVNES